MQSDDRESGGAGEVAPAQALCESCINARPLEFQPGRPVGYFSCALQKSWEFRVRCNNGKWAAAT